MSGAPVLIIGAGPAGLAAAEAASASGHAVLVVDENHAPGGQIWRGGPAQWRDKRAAGLWQRLQKRDHVRWLFGTRLVARAGEGLLLAETLAAPLVVPWQRAVICTGARELLLPFPGWTLPGVTGAGGLQALVKSGMPIAGKRVVVAGTGPLLLAVADAARRHGAVVAAVIEHQGTAALARFAGRLALSHPAKLLQAAQLATSLRGVPYLRGASVRAARGEQQLSSLVIEHGGLEQEIACDFLACGFGLLPSLESAALFGCATQQGRVEVDAAQRTSTPGVWAAGESTGIGGVDKALAEGRIAGLSVAGAVATAPDQRARASAHAFAALLARTFGAPPAMRSVCDPDTIVCRCEDVRHAELAGHAGWRRAKLMTRVGMGPCQGRVCGAACAFMFGWEEPLGRAPVFPVCASTLAGVAPEEQEQAR